MFAKLFESDIHGQILVKLDDNDKGEPEVRIYFRPEGFGVCSLALTGKDTGPCRETLEGLFQRIGLEGCERIVSDATGNLGEVVTRNAKA